MRHRKNMIFLSDKGNQSASLMKISKHCIKLLSGGLPDVLLASAVSSCARARGHRCPLK